MPKPGGPKGTASEPVASQRYIRASELARWAYCHRAWWLEYVQGHPSMNLEAMARGRAFHARYGHERAQAAWYRKWALRVTLAGAALLSILLGIGLLWLTG